MMTEEQARGKWCPFAHIRGGDNRYEMLSGEKPSTSCRCIASDCMAWQWKWRKIDKDRMVWDKEEIVDTPSAPPYKNWEQVGYCGLLRVEK